ncbi:MAG: dephospho-CoA kinase [Oscillospiraceae bacterium]|nr:dephospho-CoA kinase [Oscillospiraceae bacterium]
MAEVIGLTGQTGAGKSTVRELFKAKGTAVIDADAVSHDIVDNDLSCLTDIVEHFSCIVLNDKGKLNRKALGRIVFSDPKKLAVLNKIMFPYIVSAIKGKVTAYEHAGAQMIVIDGATLIESGCSKMCSVLISVTAEEETRLTRIIHRDGISKRDAVRRVSAQHPEEFYIEASDYVIKNNGTPGDLEREAERVLDEIEGKAKSALTEDKA